MTNVTKVHLILLGTLLRYPSTIIRGKKWLFFRLQTLVAHQSVDGPPTQS